MAEEGSSHLHMPAGGGLRGRGVESSPKATTCRHRVEKSSTDKSHTRVVETMKDANG